MTSDLTLLLIFMCFFGIWQGIRHGPLKTKEKIKNNHVIYRSLSVNDAKTALKEKNTTLIDVRTPEEYQLRHLNRSKLVPLKTIEEQAAKKLKHKEEKILVYCQSGTRSKKAVKMLYQMGYTDVYDIGAMKNFGELLKK